MDARRLAERSGCLIMNIITGVTVKQDDGYTDILFDQLELELTEALRRPFLLNERYMVQMTHTDKGVKCVVQMQSAMHSMWSMVKGLCPRFNITLIEVDEVCSTNGNDMSGTEIKTDMSCGYVNRANSDPPGMQRFLQTKWRFSSSDPYQMQRRIDGESIVWYEQELLSTMMREMRDQLGKELDQMEINELKRIVYEVGPTDENDMSQLSAEIKCHMRVFKHRNQRVVKHAVTTYKQASYIKPPSYVEMIYKCDVPVIIVKPAAVPVLQSLRKKSNKKYACKDGIDDKGMTRVSKVGKARSSSQWRVFDDQVYCEGSDFTRKMERSFGTEGLVRMGDG